MTLVHLLYNYFDKTGPWLNFWEITLTFYNSELKWTKAENNTNYLLRTNDALLEYFALSGIFDNGKLF
jgi:hypothetical protein